MIKFTAKCCSASVSSRPGGMPCHFWKHPRQQQAVACCARKTGWAPWRIGVCFPSFGIWAGARRCRTIWAACCLMVSMPFDITYSRSDLLRKKRLRNCDFRSLAKTVSASSKSEVPCCEFSSLCQNDENRSCSSVCPFPFIYKSNPACRRPMAFAASGKLCSFNRLLYK